MANRRPAAVHTFEEVSLDPHSVYFMHDRISRRFRTEDERGRPLPGGGQTLDEAITLILAGEMSPSVYPPLELVQKDGKVYSMSNRRLFVFRVLRTMGLVGTLPGKLFPFEHPHVHRDRPDHDTGEMR